MIGYSFTDNRFKILDVIHRDKAYEGKYGDEDN